MATLISNLDDQAIWHHMYWVIPNINGYHNADTHVLTGAKILGILRSECHISISRVAKAIYRFFTYLVPYVWQPS